MSRISRVAARDEPPGERVADLERRVQRRRRGEAERDLLRSDPRRGGPAGWSRAQATRAPSPVTVIRCQNCARGPRNVAANAGLRRDQPDGRARPRATVRARRRPAAGAAAQLSTERPWTATSPSTSSDPKARCRRAVWRSIIAIARAWPVAPSSADRMTWARNGSDRIASMRPGRQDLGDDRDGEDDVRAEHERRRSRSAPSADRSAPDSVEMPGPAVLADVAPLVAVQDRRRRAARPGSTGPARSATTRRSPRSTSRRPSAAPSAGTRAARRGPGSCTRAAAPCSPSRRRARCSPRTMIAGPRSQTRVRRRPRSPGRTRCRR